MKITEFYVVIDESDGIVATNLNGSWYPLVSSNISKLKSRIELAQAISNATRKTFKILKFTHPEVIRTIEPE